MGIDSELEIELTLESGLVCDFVPDFRVQKNRADHSALQWRVSGPGTPINVEFLCDELQDEESTDTTVFNGSNV